MFTQLATGRSVVIALESAIYCQSQMLGCAHSNHHMCLDVVQFGSSVDDRRDYHERESGLAIVARVLML